MAASDSRSGRGALVRVRDARAVELKLRSRRLLTELSLADGG